VDHIFKDFRLELFFGVFILFLSFTGVLGYIPKEFIVNIYILILFFLGIMLGSILTLYSLQDYFKKSPTTTAPRTRRRRR